MCSCVWAHRCKLKRELGAPTACEGECQCCVCSFRRSTLCADGDFDNQKKALAAHLRHLVMTGQRGDQTAASRILSAEVRVASGLLGAGCRAIDDDMGEDEEESEWAEDYVSKLPPGLLAAAAVEAVARSRQADSLPPDPTTLLAGMQHLPCSACGPPAAKHPRRHEAGPVEAGADDGHDVLIMQEKTFDQQQEAKLAQAKKDNRFVELSSDEEEYAAAPAPKPTWRRHLIGQAPSPKAPSPPRRGATGSGGYDDPRAAAARAAEARRATAARPAADARPPPVARPRPNPFDLEQQLIHASIQAEQDRAKREQERKEEEAAAETAMAATMAAAAAAAAASVEAKEDWRAAVARWSDSKLDALATQEPAAGGCGSWWGSAAAEETLGGSSQCALCGERLGELPGVPGVDWVSEVDANGDIVCCGTVAIGEVVSLLAVSPPCGHAVHQLCARSELRRLNARPGTSDVANSGTPTAQVRCPGGSVGSGGQDPAFIASFEGPPPYGAALLWRCPCEGCPMPAARART